jgi:hypothetical protein
MEFILILTLLSGSYAHGNSSVEHVSGLSEKNCHVLGKKWVAKVKNVKANYYAAPSYVCSPQ